MAAQLALDQAWVIPPRPRTPAPSTRALCAGCQAREARYGFRPDRADPLMERPRTLCFECFRAELGRRRSAAETIQVRLPLPPHRAGVRNGSPGLEQTLRSLRVKRRRAQIAARRALALSGL
ncbi:MAG: hypothetical protein O2930_05845 [Acidobacteria bacterium]|nr:hypothetical protein [Acidobacteriota bacterium]